MSAMFAISSGLSAEKNPQVVVVGAGIAGLTTAYRLQKGGMDVHLYEARGRVGGRIFTAKVNDHFAELGGQNIRDGGEAPHFNRLIDEFGLHRSYGRIYLVRSYFNGKDLIPINDLVRKKHLNPQTLETQIHELASTCRNVKEVLEKLFDPQDPLYKVLATRMAAYEGGPIEDLSPLYSKTSFYMLVGGLCSVHQGHKEEENYIDRLTIAGGNALLPQKMGKALGSRLHLNMPLIKLAKNKTGQFQLTFKNGSRVQADILVLAIPGSVYEQITFENGVVPSETLESIQAIRYGTAAKIMIPCTTPPKRITAVVSDEIVSFFDGSQQIITAFCTGKSSLFSPRTMADAYAQALPMIKKEFGSDCLPTTSPAYAKDQTDVSYDGPIGYSWPNDPYARGTYSYIASGQEQLLTATVEQNGETFKTLFAPIQKNLYFVGEHASILSEVPGTMEAACESGERIARVILQKKSNQ